MSNCLQLDHVDYAYGAAKILVLSDVSADFESGKMYAITGPSGAARARCCRCWPAWTPPPGEWSASKGRTSPHRAMRSTVESTCPWCSRTIT